MTSAPCGHWSDCFADNAPVCGSDGTSYSNQCTLETISCNLPPGESLTMVHEGLCIGSNGSDECPEVCPFNHKPVCGSDGETYSNKCLLEMARCKLPPGESLLIVSEGSCIKAPNRCPEVCPFNHKPVCGSDGETYSNKCLLEMARCKMQGGSLVIVREGACIKASDRCSEVCPFNYAPVCGSDGKTYSNKCNLEVASCKTPPGKSLKLVSEGVCAW